MAEPPAPGAAAAQGVTITRTFDAPREEVWKEWTEPERFADWFGGAEAEVPVSTVTMDVREGGAWRATMFTGPSRREIRWKGQYREVVPPKRLSSPSPTSPAMTATSKGGRPSSTASPSTWPTPNSANPF